MKKIFFTTIAIIVLFASCEKHERIRPSGKLEMREFSYPVITGIEVGDNANLSIFIMEDIPREDVLFITVDDNLWPFLTVNRSGSFPNPENVSIQFDHVSFIGRQPNLSITLNVRTLKQLRLNGAAFCQIQDSLICGDLRIRMTGASELRGPIEAKNISASLSGASKMDLTGHCATLDLVLSGASDMRGYNFACDDLEANFSGASSGKLTVKNTLKATLSGASSLYYDGNPDVLRRNLSGASTLQRR
jgi:hypothetical protein